MDMIAGVNAQRHVEAELVLGPENVTHPSMEANPMLVL